MLEDTNSLDGAHLFCDMYPKTPADLKYFQVKASTRP